MGRNAQPTNTTSPAWAMTDGGWMATGTGRPLAHMPGPTMPPGGGAGPAASPGPSPTLVLELTPAAGVQNACARPPEHRGWKGRRHAGRLQDPPWPNLARCSTGLPARFGAGITAAEQACPVASPPTDAANPSTGGTRLARDPRSGSRASVMPPALRCHGRGRGSVHRPPRALTPPARRPRPRSAAAGSAARPPGQRTRRRPRSFPGVTLPS